MGKLRYPWEAVAAIAVAPEVPPDLAVELLPVALWIHYLDGRPADACVDAALTLRHCYEQLGIGSQILVVSDRRTGQRNLYGTATPSWDGKVFHGRCVVYLPGSRRFVDATVEQYPEVRGLRLGPICGRMAAVSASEQDLDAFQRGELPAGAHLGVQREHLLLYTTLHGRYADVVDQGLSADDHAKAKRSGVNLAALCLNLLRHPDAIGKARRAPHPRVQQLLDQLEQFLADAPAEIARRRAAGQDVTWMVDTVEQLQASIPGMRKLAANHRVIETLGNLPAGTGLQFDELAARTGLSPGRLTEVLRQLEADGVLGPGPHSL